MHENTWVELVGNIVIARVRGVPTEAIIRSCQERVLALVKETGCRRILYDALELERPSVDTVLVQQKLTGELSACDARIAAVVPNTAIAYLARLAFGDGDYRVFYNDIAAAMHWLAPPSGEQK